MGNDPVNLVDPTGLMQEARDDNRRVIFLYPQKTDKKVLRRHGPDSPTSGTNYQFEGDYESRGNLAYKTISDAQESGNVRVNERGNTEYVSNQSGWIFSLGEGGEDFNVVVTTPLQDIKDPEVLSQALDQLTSIPTLTAIIGAEAFIGSGEDLNLDRLTEQIEVNVIITQFPTENENGPTFRN